MRTITGISGRKYSRGVDASGVAGCLFGCLPFIIWGVILIGFWGTVIYVAGHFIAKYW